MLILESEQNLHPRERRRPWILDFGYFEGECVEEGEEGGQ